VIHRLEHLARLLGARGRVEEGKRLPVNLLLEDREVCAQRARIELGAGGYSHVSDGNQRLHIDL
jgi:hypothetical protein